MIYKTKRAFWVAVATAVVLLSGCAGSDSASSANETAVTTTAVATTTAVVTTTAEPPAVTTEQEEEPEQVIPEGNLNNLTGLYDLSDEAVGKRPVAIMINNISYALPQYGIASADIIIECPVEGTITRMMAIYGDMTKIPDVCSVRSCRYYYPILALSFDAVYVHWGMDKTIAKETLNELKVDRLDGYSNSYVFDRDKERMKNYSSEHTGYFKGALTESALDKAGIRKELKEEKDKPVFNFTLQAQKISDTQCTQFTVPFTAKYFSDFTFNADEGVYYKTHNGNPHMDDKTGTQLCFTNVFVLGTQTEIINQSNLLISLDWHGGDGYYISMGRIIPVKWYKTNEFADIVITDVDGNPIEVNPGKSFIGFTPKLKDFKY